MSRAFLIAEAGVNHNGRLALAKKLVDAAAAAGADAVKFQTFRAESVLSRRAAKAPYQTRATGSTGTQLDMVRRLELPFDAFREIAAHARRRGVVFLSTPFDDESVAFLRGLGMSRFKIPSGEVTNLPHLRRVAAVGRPAIMSVGMATWTEISAALAALAAAGLSRSKVTLLHCNTAYPTPLRDANLRVMPELARRFRCRAGFSDHTLGIEASLAAAALGAAVIEKHFTLDKTLPGPDHSMSLDPRELAAWVRGIRKVEESLGTGDKRLTPSERPNLLAARRSLVASRAVACGEVFTAANVTAKRPGGGLSPMLWDRIIGRKARRAFAADEPIRI